MSYEEKRWRRSACVRLVVGRTGKSKGVVRRVGAKGHAKITGFVRTFTCLSTMRTGAPRSYLQLSLDFTETQTLSVRSISILLPNTHIKMHPHQHRVLSYQYPMCSPAAALSDPSLDGKRDRPPLRRPWAWRRLRRALFERLARRARRRKAHVLIVMAILRKVLVDLACRV